MTKRAVVVGVNNYTVLRPDGRSNLTYCVNDARSMYHLLRNAFGFSEIYYYADLRASRARILRALRHVISISEAGDSICFFFSGHGARIRADLNRADCDLYYEALVPASGAWITDRDLSSLTSNLYQDAVNFTVITDACHSGGVHVADAGLKCRVPNYDDGLIRAMVNYLRTLIPCGICLPEGSNAMNDNVSNVRSSGSGSIDLDPDPDKTLVLQTKSTLIAACRFDELSWESSVYRHGLFTKSILEIINQSNPQISYHDFLEALRSKVGSKMRAVINSRHPDATQTPQLFGQRNRMEEMLLAGWTYTPVP